MIIPVVGTLDGEKFGQVHGCKPLGMNLVYDRPGFTMLGEYGGKDTKHVPANEMDFNHQGHVSWCSNNSRWHLHWKQMWHNHLFKERRR